MRRFRTLIINLRLCLTTTKTLMFKPQTIIHLILSAFFCSSLVRFSEEKNEKYNDEKLNSEPLDISFSNNIDKNNLIDLENNDIINFMNEEDFYKDLTSNESIQIKSRDTIYLDIYKNARKKAKEIRNKAIEAFLEAKKIKLQYNLQDIEDSDESDKDEI